MRLPVAGHPALWVRLARPIPYRPTRSGGHPAVDGGRLWLAVTAAVPATIRTTWTPAQVAGVDLASSIPLRSHTARRHAVSGRAIRAESYLHLRDQQARQAKTAHRAPAGQRGSRRWRTSRQTAPVEDRHRRRSARPITKPPTRRRLRRQYGSGAGRRRPHAVSPLTTAVQSTTCGCGSGAAPTWSGVARQGRTAGIGCAGGRARHLLHLPRLPPTVPKPSGADPLPVLYLAGTGTCRAANIAAKCGTPARSARAVGPPPASSHDGPPPPPHDRRRSGPACLEPPSRPAASSGVARCAQPDPRPARIKQLSPLGRPLPERD